MNQSNEAASPVRPTLAFIARSRAKARAGSSLRIVISMATRTLSGAAASPSFAKGATLASASGRICNSQKPSIALQKPSTLQGAAMAKAMKIARSMSLQPSCCKIAPSQTSSSR